MKNTPNLILRPPRRVFSTVNLHGDVRGGWQRHVNELYGPLDIAIEESKFEGEIVRSHLGQLELTRIRTAAEVAKRDKSHISKAVQDFFLFGLGLSGDAGYEQYGRESVVAPSHFGLIYSGEPYEFRHQATIERICLKIPAQALQARVTDPHGLCSIARPVSPGLTQLVADHLKSIAREQPNLTAAEAEVVEAYTLDLIGLVLRMNSGRLMEFGSSVRRAIHRRACAYMRDSLSHPALDPTEIAAKTGISARYLHRVFAETEETVGEALLRMRLDRCREMLSAFRTQHFSMKEIASLNGFKSQSYFSNAFKRRFGLSPSELRNAVQRQR